jgi:uncharacterized membrane protein
MKDFREFATSAIVSGFLIVVSAYLAVLLLLRAMSSLAGLVRPIANLFPLWVLAEDAIALLLVLFGCFVIGFAGRTRLGGAARELVERSVLMKIPGYMLFRSLTQQLAGESQENVWKPALAEIEEALVPAFIIEEFEDGRYTVFVPSVPSPLAGAVYILSRDGVHPLSASFAQTFQTLARWGSGSRNLVAAMESKTAVK